jgi:glycosyltransferase involved in cell wall biosynthesis
VKVLQIHTEYREAGGEDAVVAAEADLLLQSGHEVVQWTNRNPAGGLAAVRALLQSPSNRGVARTVAAAARSADPDVVHVHNTWYATSPSIFGALQAAVSAPIVMTLHNYRLVCANGLLLRDGVPCELCVGSGPWKAVRYGCYRDSRAQSAAAAITTAVNRRRGSWADGVDRFLALTEFARGRVIAGGLPADKVETKPNFVPDPGARPRPPSESHQALFVGRITSEKGIGTLIEAWLRAAPAGLELIVAGDGPLYAELSAHDLPGITMLGRVDREGVQDLMFKSRALLFPSEWYEGMPMTLLEAFSSGLPVMGSDIGSMSEMLAPFGTGWLATAGSVDDWAARLATLADDSAVTTAGTIARRLWEDNYGPQKALENLVNAYRA